MAKSKVDIRAYRRDVARLKKAGLISGVDARSVQPSSALTRAINRFDDFLSGKTTPVRLSKKQAAKYKALGYDVVDKQVVLYPHSIDEKVRKGRDGIIERTHTTGIKSVSIPVEYHNLEQYLEELIENADKLDKQLSGNRLLAFRMYGYNSILAYPDAEEMLADIMAYRNVSEALSAPGKRRANDQGSIYRNLEIVSVPSASAWARNKRSNAKKTVDIRRKSPFPKERAKKAPTELSRAKKAAYMRTWRDNLTEREKEAYKRAARKRARKSRKK